MEFILFFNIGILILIILLFNIKQIKSSFTNSKNDKLGTKYIESDSKETTFSKERKEKQIPREEDKARKLFDMGCKLSHEGKYEEAIEFFDKSILAKPNYAYAWYNKGDAFFYLSMYKEAMKCYKEVKDIDYDLYCAFGRRNEKIILKKKLENFNFNEERELFIKKENTVSKEDIVRKLFDISCILLNKGRYKEATEVYDRAVLIDPNHAAMLYYEKEKSIDPNSYFALNGKRVEDIDKMDGYEFEKFVGGLFKKRGYSVEHTSLSGDQGADLIISKLEERSVVQTKRHKGKVSNKAIQEVVASRMLYRCNSCIVVTNSYFTKSAIELGNVNNVKLIDRDELEFMIKYT
jgi:restriction system protein